MTPENARRLCDAIGRGIPMVHACAAVGISFSLFCKWRTQDEEFAAALEAARGDAIDRRLKRIEAAAEKGEWRADAWMLEHCFPEHFAKSRVQVEHTGTIEHQLVIPQETLKQLAEARQRVERERVNIITTKAEEFTGDGRSNPPLSA